MIIGCLSRAPASFREGIEVARANTDPFIEAYLQRALGALLVRDGPAAEGLAHLETALKLFGEMRLDHEVTETRNVLQVRQTAKSV